MGPQNVICHSPATAQMHLAEMAIALAAKIHWMHPLSLGDDDDYAVRSRLTDSNLMGGGNPGIARIYDSIATILVSQPRHEHIAATMHFYHPRHAILLIANNQPFDAAKIHTYLRKVWTLLRGLSRAFAAIRLEAQEPSPTIDFRDRAASFFHALHDQRVSPLIHDLKVLIYSHAVDKFHRRIDKRWEGFQALLKALKTIVNNAEVPQAEPNMNYLNLVRVSEFLEFLRERDVDCGEDFFIRIVDGFNAAAAEIPNVQLDEWSTLVYWHHPGVDHRPFPLRKYLDKIKDLNRHIHALIGYTHSPHLRHYFSMELSVQLDIPHESESYTIPIPRSVSQWSIVAESILDSDHLELIDPDTVLQRVVFEYTNTLPDPVPAHVHSEVRLLHYLESIGEASGQIYIGLNRPSCMGCHFYVRGYNKRCSGSCVATTRDPRDRYVFPWNLPSETGTDFRREVFECVKEDLRERFVMFGFTKTKVGE